MAYQSDHTAAIKYGVNVATYRAAIALAKQMTAYPEDFNFALPKDPAGRPSAPQCLRKSEAYQTSDEKKFRKLVAYRMSVSRQARKGCVKKFRKLFDDTYATD